MNLRRAAAASAVVAATAVAPLIHSASGGGHYVAAKPICGVARWKVKTVADGAAASIDSHAAHATVAGLATLVPPPHVGNDLPRQAAFGGVEFKTYNLDVRLVGWKLSDNDSDIHLEVRGITTQQTMVVEFPLAGCVARSASKNNRSKMNAARRALIKACGGVIPGTATMTMLRGRAHITGIGFFDKSHGQGGRADNGIEIHPTLLFESSSCKPL